MSCEALNALFPLRVAWPDRQSLGTLLGGDDKREFVYKRVYDDVSSLVTK